MTNRNISEKDSFLEPFNDVFLDENIFESFKIKADKMTNYQEQIKTKSKIENIDLIKQFLKEFTIKLETKSSNANSGLNRLILETFKKYDKTLPYEAFYDFFNYLYKWFIDPKNCSLKSEELISFATNLKNNMERFYFLSETDSFKENCEKISRACPQWFSK